MKCREFQKSVADYEGGRQGRQQAQAMDDHKAVCSACAQSCVQEREMRQRFQAMQIPTPIPDIWPQVASQLQTPAVPGRFLEFRRMWGRALCGVGVCAGFLCFGIVSYRLPPQNSDSAQTFTSVAANRPPANDTIIGLVSKMRDGEDTEASWSEEASGHQEKRSLLLGEQN